MVLSEQRLIWIIEDNKDFLTAYQKTLGSAYRLEIFSNIQAIEALWGCKKAIPHLVVVEPKVEDFSWFNFLKKLLVKKEYCPPWIVASSIDDLDMIRFCYGLGAQDYFVNLSE